MTLRPTLLVVAVSLASLAGWRPLRVVEQLPAPLLRAADGLLSAALPRDALLDDREHVEALRSEAHDAWVAWTGAVMERPAPGPPGVELFLAPVMGGDARRRELLIKVPPRAVLPSTPVTWRGVLLGFLRPWRADGERVDQDGLAKVALLGHPLARPVAATWQAGPSAAAVHFLLTSGDDGPTIAHPSRPFDPLPGQLAWSRDVRALGDDLPAGLLLGKLMGRPTERDRPGGGLVPRVEAPGGERVLPLADPFALGHVVVELAAPAAAPARALSAHLVGSASSRRVRIDRGLLDGVREGDLVVQDAALVGRVETAGPLDSLVAVGQGTGLLLVLADDGGIVATGRARADWPAGWQPVAGRAVLGGHRTLGGFRVGTLAGADDDGLLIRPAVFDPGVPVTVVEP